MYVLLGKCFECFFQVAPYLFVPAFIQLTACNLGWNGMDTEPVLRNINAQIETGGRFSFSFFFSVCFCLFMLF